MLSIAIRRSISKRLSSSFRICSACLGRRASAIGSKSIQQICKSHDEVNLDLVEKVLCDYREVLHDQLDHLRHLEVDIRENGMENEEHARIAQIIEEYGCDIISVKEFMKKFPFA
jgi:hypothetical protein